MGIGTSIFLIAVGAILDFAVTVRTDAHGFNINTVGLILMIVGAIGLVLSLLFWSSWGGFGSGYRRRRTVYRDAAVDGYVDPNPAARVEYRREVYEHPAAGTYTERRVVQTQPPADGTVVRDEWVG